MTSFSPTKLLFCALFLLLSCTQAKLVVKYPDTLNTKIDVENGIDYTILTPQNKITYKKAFIGILTLAEPANACDHIDSISTLQDQIYNPILLVEWGDCHYAQKVKNAENAGAKMVLITLRHDMQLNHPAVRPLQINTNIEVLAISQSHGNILSDYIKEKREAKEDASVELTYSYEVERHVNYRKDDNVLIDFWYSSGDASSYELLGTLGDVLKEFGRNVNFNPHYMMWECDSEGDSCRNNARCIADGKYCDPEPLIEGKMPGKEAVNENLWQICFRELNSRTDIDNEWWRYVRDFGEQCVKLDVKDIGACRNKIADQFDDKIMEAVSKCMKESFEKQGMNPGKNIHLSRELNQKEEMHVDHYPALYINKERYQGSFRNRYMLKDFICSHFVQEKQPAACNVTPSSTTTQEGTSGSEVGVYVVLILVSILLMALMIYCVRRSVKRQVMFRMNDEISHIVTQYKQFKDKSNSFSIDDDN